MKNLRRLWAIVITMGLIAGSILPSTALALTLPAGTAFIDVVSVSAAFDPTLGQKANITYKITGDSTANGVMVRIYKPSVVGTQECDLVGGVIALIDGPMTRTAQDSSYIASWNGVDQNGVITKAGQIAPAGTYCYHIQWGNPPNGSLNYVAGFLMVSQPVAGAMNGVNAGTGTGSGSVSGAVQPIATGNPCNATGTGAVIASVNPDTIDPTKGESTDICYYVNQELPYGFSLYIYNGSNRVVWSINKGDKRTKGDWDLISWDGKFSGGGNVDPGKYIYKFYVSGQVATYGSINIINRALVTPGSQPVCGSSAADISFSVNPSTIILDPTAPNYTTSQPATLTYTINHQVTTGLTIYIRDVLTGNPVKSLIVKAGTLAPCINYLPVTWDGKFSNGYPVKEGPYQFVISSAGVDIDYWPVTVKYVTSPGLQPGQIIIPPPPANIFIVSKSATPTSFYSTWNSALTPNFTTINFTTGKTVSNFKINIKDPFGNSFASVFPQATLAPGSYSATWSGLFQPPYVQGAPIADFGSATPGTYTYTFEATNESPVFGGTITVLPIPIAAQFITSQSAFPQSFNPFSPANEQTAITFTTGKTVSNFLIRIKNDAGNTVQTLFANPTLNTGTYKVIWDGTSLQYVNGIPNSITVPQGAYTYTFEASNETPVVGSVSLYVKAASTPGQNAPVIADFGPDKSSFNPQNGETATLRFQVNQDARVDAYILDQNNVTVRRLLSSGSTNNVLANVTSNLIWRGKTADDTSTASLPTGTYTYYIEARNSNGVAQTRQGTIYISTGSVNNTLMQVSNLSADSFNPEQSSGTLRFYINQNANVTITLYRPNGTFLETVKNNVYFTSGFNSVTWNGTDSDSYGNFVPSGSYKFTVEASNPQYGYDEDSAYVRVNRTTIITDGLGGYTGNCGNFTDVSRKNFLCPAIDFVKSRGIFGGYSDGTLRPEKVIQRVEFLVVIQKAFRFPLQSYSASRDGNLGYRDLTNKTNEWYMPYIKTFKNLGLMVGYPDGNFRPERTMNTAELYFVFLKAAKRAPQNITHFTLEENGIVYKPPFIDTPIRPENRWYLKFAEFAQLNDLVITDRFYPERGITRGQVIKLIYDTYQKGLITYGDAPYTGDTTATNYPPTGTNTMQVSSLSGTSFNPSAGGRGSLLFNLNKSADVSINLYRPDGSFLKTLQSNTNYPAGVRTVYWDGKDANNSYVPAGTYRFTVSATNSQYGYDSETGYITVTNTASGSGTGNTGTNQLLITNVSTNSFTPSQSVANGVISFYNNYDANFTITVYRPNGTFLKTLQSNQFYGVGSHTISWDGIDPTSSMAVPPGSYQVILYGVSSQHGYNQVSTNINVQ